MDGNEIWEDVISNLTTGDGMLSHADLYLLRKKAPPEFQKDIALLEHQAFAREWVAEEPLLATASLAFAIPAYTAGKATGLVKGTRSPASLDEIVAGYEGILQGLGIIEPRSAPGTKMGVRGDKPRKQQNERPKNPPSAGPRG